MGRAATFLLLLLAAPFGDPIEEAIAAFRERMGNAPDTMARVIAVHELGFRKDPRVVPVLRPLLQSPVPELRIAAAQQIGEQKDPSVAPLLIALYEKEEFSKDRSVPWLAALLEGVGDADAKGRFKFLEKAYRRWFGEDSAIVRASVRAMALARTPDAVENLVTLLESAETGARAPVMAEEKRGEHEATRILCHRLLRGVTGIDLKSAKAWRDWWRENRRTWKAPPPGGVPSREPGADPMSWTDASREFSVRWPSKGWTVHDSEECLLSASRAVDGRPVARFWVEADAIDGAGFKDAGSMAKAWRGSVDRQVLDQKPERCRWNENVVFGGESAVLHEAFGRMEEYGVVTLRHVFVVHHGYMFHVTGVAEGAPDDPVRKEFDDLFASFRFLKK
jgi:hypothetical protein